MSNFPFVTLHVVGVVIAYALAGLAWFRVSEWQNDRDAKAIYVEASLALGISTKNLDDIEHSPRVLKYFAAQYSGELLRNRLSDLCGLVQIAWNLLGAVLAVGVLIVTVWSMATGNARNVIYLWLVLPIGLLNWLVSEVFSWACKLLTGRYPGQAKWARRMLIEETEKRRVNFEATRSRHANRGESGENRSLS